MSTLTLRSAGDIIAAVPFLFGFHPSDSVVLLALRGRRVVFQARTDAPAPADVDHLAAYLAEIAARQSPTAVVLIGYGPADPVSGALGVLRAAVAATGVAVLDALRVHEGRYWSLTCADPACCPAGGTPYDPSTSVVAAAATYEGMVALPDRASLAAGLAPRPGAGLEPEIAAAQERLAALPGGARGRRAASRAAVRQAFTRCTAGGRLDDDEVAWLAVLLRDTQARDEAWRRTLAAGTGEEHRALWRDIACRVPDRFAAPPATLLALAAWRSGDGATASVAAERALAVDPGYALAELVLQALAAAIPPSTLDPLPDPPPRRRPRVRAA